MRFDRIGEIMNRDEKALKPALMRLSKVVSKIGLLPIFSIGFGRSSVKGRNRVPKPPAINNTGLLLLGSRGGSWRVTTSINRP